MEIYLNHRILFKYGGYYGTLEICLFSKKEFNLICGNVRLFVKSSHPEVLYIKKVFLKVSHVRVRLRGQKVLVIKRFCVRNKWMNP